MAKKKAGGGQTKLQRAKIISGMTGAKPSVDKTFGMKNKKGAKAQKNIAIMNGGTSAAGLEKARMKMEMKKRQAQEEKDARMMGSGYAKSTGKKSKKVLKEEAEAKAKMANKSAKKDLYADERDEKQDDTMDDWDTDKLNDVVNQKHGKEKNAKTTTLIICKHFLKSVEKGQYGWFWECPAGGLECMYRHALPPGYVLKKAAKDDDEEEEKISLTVLIQEERQKLVSTLKPGTSLTKVTEETFKAWKKKKIMEKKLALKREMKKKKEKLEADGGKVGGITGRDLFSMGHARTENGEEDEGGAGGDVDYKALRKAAEAAEDEADDADPSAKKQPRAFVIDDSLFAMDLGDMELHSEDEDDEGGDDDAGGGAKKDAVATNPDAATAAPVEVDLAGIDLDDLDLAGIDLDGIDDA